MDITHIIAFNIALFAALVSPGPAMLCAIQAALSQGRYAGIKVGLGLATIASTWNFLALLGFEVIFQIFPWLYVSVKFMGGAYLIYIAYKIWKHAPDEIHQHAQHVKNPYSHGIMINLLNPKSILFAAAMIAVIFPPDLSIFEILFVTTNQFMAGASFYAMIAVGFSTNTIVAGYLGAKKYLDRASALIIGALGLKLIWNR